MVTTGRQKAPDEQYCSSCGEIMKSAAEFCIHCGVRNAATSPHGTPAEYSFGRNPYAPARGEPRYPVVHGRDKWVAVVLVFFLGGFGIHKFYLGKPVQGIFYLLFFWTLIPSVIAFVEFLIYLFTPEHEFRARYPYV